MKSFLVSDHATEKIWERGISWQDVPDVRDISEIGRRKVVKKIGGRELAAVYKIDAEVVVLMTSYWRNK